MDLKGKRNSTRSHAWPETEATIRLSNSKNAKDTKKTSISGKVLDIGASGMFLETSEIAPENAEADIEIRFDSQSKSSPLKLHARGKITRSAPEGMGIRFLSIDLARLQECIVKKMNRTHQATSKYTLKDGRSA